MVEFCCALPAPTCVAYEAGPTGYGLARALHAAGVGCVVAAPGKIERRRGDRVKTDQRDAERLVAAVDDRRQLHAVRVPSLEEEALRDLVRAREAVRGDLMRARQRLSKLLLRHDVRYRGHRQRVDRASPRVAARRSRSRWPAAQATLLEHMGAIDALELTPRRAGARRSSTLIPGSPWARRSPGCGACAGSTRSPRSGCAPRSATSRGSRAPRS